MNLPATAYIAFGSNLGDRRRHLSCARELLAETPGLVVGAASSLYETAPVGGPPGQEPYFNAVVRVETTLLPRPLLERCHAIEEQLGRQRKTPWGPRTIDLDLLLYGAACIADAELIVPHPRLHQRSFVLAPLCELAPKLVHPVLAIRLADLPAATADGGAILCRHASWS